MTGRFPVRLTANFQRNLEEIEQFLTLTSSPQVYDALLDELVDTAIPMLEQFPKSGRIFQGQRVHSAIVRDALRDLRRRAALLGTSCEIREHVLSNYLTLYAILDNTVYLLSIKHYRQRGFDFAGMVP